MHTSNYRQVSLSQVVILEQLNQAQLYVRLSPRAIGVEEQTFLKFRGVLELVLYEVFVSFLNGIR